MQTTPILGYVPGGGVGTGSPVEPFIPGVNGDITQLVSGQSYIQIIFDVTQTDNTWEFVELVVVNTTDLSPLNIWPGILTAKSRTGFTLQFNGMPDSNNYFLHWSFTGTGGGSAPVVIPPATTYTLSGPNSGTVGIASTNFTVSLPGGTTLASPVTVTPSDSGGGGTFTPTSVTLTTGAPSATFTYTPASTGAKTISTTNSGTLTDPANLTYTSTAGFSTTYTLTGPSSGTVSVASTNFTVALPGGGSVSGTVIVTPADAGAGGTFTPTTVNLTTGAPSATFTYTPSTTGAKTISVTNSGGLTDPGSLTYAVSPADGTAVSSWPDSSANGHTGTQSGAARPTFKTNILNGKPVVRFTSASSQCLNIASAPAGAGPWTVFAVTKLATAGAGHVIALASSTVLPIAAWNNGTGATQGFADANFYTAPDVSTSSFEIITCKVPSHACYSNGTALVPAFVANAAVGNFETIGCRIAGPTYSDGDIAEIILYNTDLGTTNRANVEKYLGTKYGISVAGGSAVDPSTVTGLVAWWKADAIV